MRQKIVLFRIGDSIFSVVVSNVVEVLRVSNITKVPGTPDYIIGLFNRLGEPIVAVELSALIPTEQASGDMFLVVEYRNEKFAFHIDDVVELIDLELDDLIPEEDNPFVLGRFIWGGKPAAVIDLDALFKKMSGEI
ncbi:MAG: hypothetical protein DRQ10_03250 [Candidatus Hydrothermota bacterium]|nr:MAG: hypothetical protein DRQ10_03250 [Candidatus Hydrothermae bacterium]